MSASIHGRMHRPPTAAPVNLLAAMLATLLLGLIASPAPLVAQQANFRPLERGEFTEVEQRLMVAQALQVNADYALRIRNQNNKDLPADAQDTQIGHDMRLKLSSVFHTDVALHLTLELVETGFTEGASRKADGNGSGSLNDGFATNLNAREAYLQYRFNPRSSLLTGKQELSLGDRRGKTFHALVPGITVDCNIATWCMPFGLANLGRENSSSVIHWALQYNAWDEENTAGRHDRLQVEVFRVIYQESDVPLGKNLGPGRYNADAPMDPLLADPSQIVQTTGVNEPVYYDARDTNYYGFRLLWEGGPFFAHLDAVGMKGERRYHLYNESGNLDLTGTTDYLQPVRGSTAEAEFGFRWDQGRAGMRYMTATGDSYQANTDGQTYTRALSGYYEIVPGAYRGTRLWFNGVDSPIDGGAGLGHSINNTRMFGLYMEQDDPEKTALGYAFALYDLRYNNPIPNAQGQLKDEIGVEVNAMFTFHLHKALKLQTEANALIAGGAFRIDDFTLPSAEPENLYQFVARLVYSF